LPKGQYGLQSKESYHTGKYFISLSKPHPISKIIMFQDPENQKEFRRYVIHGYTGEGKLEIFLFINDLNNADNRSYQETNSPTEATFL
jgi:hypothetical protein